MRTRRMRYVAAVSAFSIGLVAAVAAPGGAQASSPAAPTLATQAVLNRINTLGVLDYPGSYLTVKATSNHAITIYDTGHYAAFFHDVAKIGGIGGYTIRETRVARSYGTLETLTKRMAQDSTALAESGISMAEWGPDVDKDVVSVTLASPKGTQAAAVPANSGALAANVLASRFGSGLISVAATTSPLAVKQDARDSDEPPYYGGDGYTDNNTDKICTTSFAVKGNSTGKYYLLSAAHCSAAVGDSTDFGAVAGRYYTSGWDFDTILAGTGTSSQASAHVWFGADGSTSAYKVLGTEVPAVGGQVTVDGDAESGQRTGNTVELVGNSSICITETDSDGSNPHMVCDIGYAQHSGTVCRSGDSGGPIYDRTSPPGGVYAVGINVAATTVGGVDKCYFQEIGPILSHAGLTLVTTT